MCLKFEALDTVTIKQGWLTKSLRQLIPTKAPGLDNMSPRILRLTADLISFPLLHIMNCSLSSGTLPSAWKMSNIVPVYKSDSRADVRNYRPVALTSVVCKIMERAVAEHINDHISSFCLENETQHGFKARRYCVTQLTDAVQDWASILDKPRPPRIDIAFLDFSKAFDIMPHTSLLNKLASNFNIRGHLWTWLKSFLVGREQRVTYRAAASSWSPVTSGVPQGSVQGPLLFNLFINDLIVNLTNNTFALC